MKIPTEIQELVKFGIEETYHHPQHMFNWRIRRDIYKLFAQHPLGKQVHNWLAVLAAEQVLPIFTKAFPEDDLPSRIFDAARKMAEDSNLKELIGVNTLLDEGYHSLGLDAIDWHHKVAFNAEYAGFTAYKALLEVTGNHHLLEGVEKIQRGTYPSGEMIMSTGGIDSIAAWETGDTFSDKDIAHLAAFGDTASTAAIASSCNEKELLIDSERLLNFWLWWSNSALTEAWKRV